MIHQVSSSELARLNRGPRVNVSEIVGLSVIYLLADFSRPGAVTDNGGQPLAANPFLDVRVRRPLSLAIAREAIAERVMKGQAGATAQWLPPGAAPARNSRCA